MNYIQKNLEVVNASIRQAAMACGRNAADIYLVAVSKTVGVDGIRKAIEAGATQLGENYVQEVRDKVNALGTCSVSWHFIGHLQTNKAKAAVGLFDVIHTVDSFKLAQELDKQANRIHKIQNILIQVNIGKERSKSGVDPARAIQLIREISRLESLNVMGLMTMPPFFEDPEKVRPYFSALRQLRDRINAEAISNMVLSELSMGMSSDFKIAIAEGATIVRIGTAIFGKRP